MHLKTASWGLKLSGCSEEDYDLMGQFAEEHSPYIKRQQMIHNWLAAGPVGRVSRVNFFSALQTLTLNCDK